MPSHRFETADRRVRRAWLAVGWGLVASIVYLSLGPVPELVPVRGGDKVGHLLAYFTLMIWFAQAVARRGWPPLAVACLGLGVALEFVQGMVGRDFSLADMVADGIGVAAAWALAFAGVDGLLSRAERMLAGWPG